jgi:large subunit ribosomal protein L5
MTDTQRKQYQDKIKQVQEELGIKNVMAVPTLKKIVVNIGVKNAVADKKNMEVAEQVLATITGQKPRVNRAKKSISSFKLREGDKIGLTVTLRGNRMHEFFYKLVNVVLPRIKDFRGVSNTAFDKQGNYTLGLSEYSVFPEVDTGKIERVLGLEMTIVTTATKKEDGVALMKALGMPFKN